MENPYNKETEPASWKWFNAIKHEQIKNPRLEERRKAIPKETKDDIDLLANLSSDLAELNDKYQEAKAMYRQGFKDAMYGNGIIDEDALSLLCIEKLDNLYISEKYVYKNEKSMHDELKAENERLKQKISASNKLIEENKKSFKSELYNLRRALKRKDFAPINPELIQSKAENERLINKIHQLRLKINSIYSSC